MSEIQENLFDIIVLGEATELTQGLGGMWPEHGGTEEFRGA